MKPTWKTHSAVVIQRVIDANPTATTDELKKLVSDAYPFGERKYHPYKQWLKAVKEAFAEGEPVATESVRNMWIK